MSSILTNTGAMVALQTMRSVNQSLAQTQNEISTGKSVSNARDNAAVWAVAKTMQADVKGFNAISDTLALGRSTVGVARVAAETVTNLLTQMQGKIVAAQEYNVDRGKIQNDVVALRNQINAVVGGAQFNGLNLVNGSSDGNMRVLSSLDRASNGTVTASHIDVAARNFGTGAAVVDTTGGTFAAGGGAAAQVIDDTDASRSFTVANVTAGTAFSLSIAFSGVAGDDAGGSLGSAADISFVAGAGATSADVLNGLAAAFNTWAESNDAGGVTVSVSGGSLVVERAGLDTGESLSVAIDTVVSDDNQAAGGLLAMAGIDVSTRAGAESALQAIEGLIQFSIDSAASFGSAQMRIDTQAEFIRNLTDAMNTGIGAMVDADMEATSAKLQALQVQQQLAIQSLSIANQAPQNILSLFR